MFQQFTSLLGHAGAKAAPLTAGSAYATPRGVLGRWRARTPAGRSGARSGLLRESYFLATPCYGATCSWELPAPAGMNGGRVMNDPTVPV